jgi:hypothetical protein
MYEHFQVEKFHFQDVTLLSRFLPIVELTNDYQGMNNFKQIAFERPFDYTTARFKIALTIILGDTHAGSVIFCGTRTHQYTRELRVSI